MVAELEMLLVSSIEAVFSSSNWVMVAVLPVSPEAVTSPVLLVPD